MRASAGLLVAEVKNYNSVQCRLREVAVIERSCLLVLASVLIVLRFYGD
jgi:hypothetical protein